MKLSLIAALGGISFLAACASPPPPPAPRPIPMANPTPPPAMPTGDGRVATVTFDANSAEFTQAGRSNIGPVAMRMMNSPESRAVITTYSGPRESGMARQRAAAVRQFLIDGGVPAQRIRVVNGRMMPNADVNGVQVQVQDGPARRS